MVTLDPLSDFPLQSSPVGPPRSLADRWHLLLGDAVDHHSKVLAVAFRLETPGWPAPSAGCQPIQAFLAKFTRRLADRHLDPRLIWVRVGDVAARPAYLVLVLLDGHRTQSASGHLATAQAIWDQLVGRSDGQALVVPCSPADGWNGLMIRKDHPDWETALADCSRWAGRLLAHGSGEWGAAAF